MTKIRRHELAISIQIQTYISYHPSIWNVLHYQFPKSLNSSETHKHEKIQLKRSGKLDLYTQYTVKRFKCTFDFLIEFYFFFLFPYSCRLDALHTCIQLRMITKQRCVRSPNFFYFPDCKLNTVLSHTHGIVIGM